MGPQFEENLERLERGEFPRGTPVPVVPDNAGGRN